MLQSKTINLKYKKINNNFTRMRKVIQKRKNWQSQKTKQKLCLKKIRTLFVFNKFVWLYVIVVVII